MHIIYAVIIEEVNGIVLYTLIALHSKKHLMMSLYRKMAALQAPVEQMYIF